MMSPERNAVFYVFITIQFVNCFGVHYISNNTSSWTDAPSRCKAGAPRVKAFTQKNGYSVEILENLDLERESVWTGYYMTEMAFEYIGCVKLDDISNDTIQSEVDVTKDPSLCYPVCEHSAVIAVAKDKCYCLKTLSSTWTANTQRPDCNIDCDHPRGTACGGKHKGDTYLSIYRMNPNVSTIPDNDDSSGEDDVEKSCLSVDLESSETEWKRCSERCAVRCSDEDGNINLSSNYKEDNWFKAAQTCLRDRKYPLRLSEAISLDHDSTVWTGAFKMNVIFGSRSISGTSKHALKYGVITEKGHGHYFLEFTEDENSLRRILCEGDLSTPPTTTDTGTPGNNELKKQTSTTLRSPPLPQTNSDVAIGVSVTLIVLAGAIVLAIVLIRKRYMHSHRFNKMSEGSETGPGQEYAYPDFSAISREPEQNARNDPVYNYPDFSLANAYNASQYVDIPGENVDTESNSELDGRETSNNVITNDEEGVGSYETTESTTGAIHETVKASRSDGEGEGNSYDKIEFRNSYDGLDQRTEPRPGKGHDKTTFNEADIDCSGTGSYDVTSSLHGKIKQRRDKSTDNIYNIEVEIYNTTHDKVEQMKTDNLYGAKQMERFKHILKPKGDEHS